MIRHGQSEGNVAHIYCGQMDTPLTELGRQQARQAGERLKGITFDKVYSSPLSRARETASLAVPYLEAETDARLMEINVGELAGHSFEDCAKEMGKKFLDSKEEWDFTPFGGENKQMMMERASAFLARVASENDECVAAFCHAGMCSAILMAVLGVPLNRYTLYCDNTAIAVFGYREGRWILEGWNIGGAL